MAIERIHLRNFMRLALANPAHQTSLLRENIRADIKREAGAGGGGMNFYTPFWADAKNHARGALNLRPTTDARVEANRGRRNRYPALCDGFLLWWEDRRRRRNEPFAIVEERILGDFEIEGHGVIVVDNILAVRIGDAELRIVYPYFFDEPELGPEMAAIGLWAMSQALPTHRIEDMRVLDVMQGVSYSVEDVRISGNEENSFRERYRYLLGRWSELRAEPRYN